MWLQITTVKVQGSSLYLKLIYEACFNTAYTWCVTFDDITEKPLYLVSSSKCCAWGACCCKCKFNIHCPFLVTTSHQPAKWNHQGVYCQHNWSRDSQLDCAQFNNYIPTGAFLAPILHLWMCGQCIYCWQWTIQWGVDRNNFRGWYVFNLLPLVTSFSILTYFLCLEL